MAGDDARRYVPALDGLRGLAVALVLLFHGDVPLVRGGHVGVTAFFVLSGFLITSLLLRELAGAGRVDLVAFWGRRAKRLVPAALLTLPLVAVVVAVSDTPPSDGVVGDAVAAAAWVANWHFVAAHQSYADLFSLPSPFQHFWSLAVEEQFYLVLPLLLLAVGARRARLGVAALVLLVASVAQGLHLGGRGFTDRAWYGTDTRAAELLVGVLLAVLLTQEGGLRELAGPARRAVDVAGWVGLLGLLTGAVVLDQDSRALFRGGLLAVAVATAAVVAAATQQTLLARALAAPPLVALGVVSYGAYLFHWPVFLALTERTTGAPAALLLALRVVTTLVLALLSYTLVEYPVRHGRVPWRVGVSGWASASAAGVAAIAVAAGQLVLPLPHPTTLSAVPPAPAGVAPVVGAGQAPQQTAARPQVRAQSRVAAAPQQPAPVQTAAPVQRERRREALPAAFTADPDKAAVPPVPKAPPGAVKVVVVGDSIGNNLGTGLLAWAQGRSDVVVYNLAVPGCPLSRGKDRRVGDREFDVRPVCGWWADAGSKRRQAMEQFAPDVVVAQDGVNEVFDRRQPGWSDWRKPGDPQFDQWLVGEYGTAVDQWRSRGAKVLMTNAPCGDFDRYQLFHDMHDGPQRVQSLDGTVYPRVLGVSQANLMERICPAGQYSDTVEGVPNARPDGFHLIPEASAALARNWLGPLVLQTASSPVSTVGIG